MYVESVPNRNSPPAVLLRESYRHGGKVRKRTLANLSKWPPALVDGLGILLKGGAALADPAAAVDILRSRPHGHVAAVLGTVARLRLDRTLAGARSRHRDCAVALIAARILAPGSKLATARRLSPATADSSLGALLSLGPVSGNEMLAMLDWLLGRQRWIETSLANRHLSDATLVLYDVSSSYLEGRLCPLAAFGYNRDGKQGKQQIVFGLLCSAEGCPLAVQVFAGNTADPATVAAQVQRIRKRFGMRNIALVGDRGMLTTARIREDVEPAGLDWISALKSQHLRTLLKRPQPAAGQDAMIGREPQCPNRPFCQLLSPADFLFGNAAHIDGGQPAIQSSQPLEKAPAIIVVFRRRIGFAQASHHFAQLSWIAFSIGEAKILVIRPDPARLAKVIRLNALQGFARLLQKRSRAGQISDIFQGDAELTRMESVNLDDDRLYLAAQAFVQHNRQASIRN
jgi:hypothetical protein